MKLDKKTRRRRVKLRITEAGVRLEHLDVVLVGQAAETVPGIKVAAEPAQAKGRGRQPVPLDADRLSHDVPDTENEGPITKRGRTFHPIQ